MSKAPAKAWALSSEREATAASAVEGLFSKAGAMRWRAMRAVLKMPQRIGRAAGSPASVIIALSSSFPCVSSLIAETAALR